MKPYVGEGTDVRVFILANGGMMLQKGCSGGFHARIQ